MKTIVRRIQKLEWTSGFGPAGADQPKSVELQFICPETKDVVATRVIEIGRRLAGFCSKEIERVPRLTIFQTPLQ